MTKCSMVIGSLIYWASTYSEELAVGYSQSDLASNGRTQLCHVSCNVASICAVQEILCIKGIHDGLLSGRV